MHIYAIVNNKGGITKTTTTVNLGYGLAKLGYRVLVVDFDAQSNSTWTLLQKVRRGSRGTIYDAIMRKRPLHELIAPTMEPNLFLVRSSLWLGYAETQLFNEPMRERRLRNALRPYLSKFEYVLIDTPPNLGILTINALMACTDALIPVTLNGYSLLGINILLNTIKTLRANALENEIDAPMPIMGVIVAQTRENKDAAGHLANIETYFGDLVFDAKIPLNVDVERANNRLGALYDLYPKSSGAIAYASLVQEMIAREKAMQELGQEAYMAKTLQLLEALPGEEDEEDE